MEPAACLAGGDVVQVQAVVAGAGQQLAPVGGPAQRPDAEVLAVRVWVVPVLRGSPVHEVSATESKVGMLHQRAWNG